MSLKIIKYLYCIFTLLFLVSLSIADTVYLTDGRKISGEVLSCDDNEVKIQVQTGSIKATLILKRSDVVKIEQTKDPAKVLDEEYQKKMQSALSASTSEETYKLLLELARWSKGHGLIDRACQIYRQLVKLRPDYADITQFEWAKVAMENKLFQEARDVITQLLTRNPNHEQARLLAEKVREEISNEIEASLQRALKTYMSGAYANALALIVKFIDSHSPEDLEIASKATQEKLGQSLASILIDCRFNQKCESPGCQNGLIKCSNPNCNNGFVKKVSARTNVNYFTGTDSKTVVWIFCPDCEGKGYTFCKKCYGTGIDFGRITQYEKGEMIKTLLTQADQLIKDGLEISKKASDPNQDANIRGIFAQNLISMSRRAQFFLMEALRLHPPLGSAGGENLNEKIRQINTTRGSVLSTIARAYLSASDVAYQEAVNKGSEKEGERSVSGRTVRAREALELAKSARLFVSQAIEEDGAQVSPMQGDLKNLLRLIEEYIVRCEKTYTGLAEAERRGVKISVEDILKLIGK